MYQALRKSGRGRIFTAINVTAMNIGGTVGVLQALACKPNGQGYILCIDIRTITLTEIIFTAFIVTAMNMAGTVGVLRALACNPSGQGNLLSIEIMTSTIWAQFECVWKTIRCPYRYYCINLHCNHRHCNEHGRNSWGLTSPGV